MKILKLIWRRLTRDLVDLLLWLSVIALLIKALLDYDDSTMMIFFGSLLILYIMGVMWRGGASAEIMNEYIKDPADRQHLQLLPYELRDRAWKKELGSYLFVLGWIIILVLSIILL